MNTNRINQIKYNRIYLNRELPTEQELAEIESSKAMRACLKEAGRDYSVLALFITAVLLLGVIMGC